MRAPEIPTPAPETLNMPRQLEPVAVAAEVPRPKPVGAVARPYVLRWSAAWVVAGVLAFVATGEAI